MRKEVFGLYARVENKSKITPNVLPNPFNTPCESLDEDDSPAELVTLLPQDPKGRGNENKSSSCDFIWSRSRCS